jgi:hypothetical protein
LCHSVKQIPIFIKTKKPLFLNIFVDTKPKGICYEEESINTGIIKYGSIFSRRPRLAGKKVVRVYDGSKFCKGSHCPVVDHIIKRGKVIIYDPDKPKNGRFVTTVREYNLLLVNAKLIK